MRKVRFICQATFKDGHSMIQTFDLLKFPKSIKINDELLEELCDEFNKAILSNVQKEPEKYGLSKKDFSKKLNYRSIFKISILGWSFF